ncbi:MAG TPA: long-chain fatty acid--CoA ligase [Stellaceae bacterium]|nr:long-chain fatty acid--CoA ligase [Stellaceae bacterium]
MRGLIMDMPLLLSGFIDYAAEHHGATEIVARTIEGDIHRYTYAAAQRRAKRLAQALLRLGIKPGDRVASLAWNTHRHFEMFYGVTGMGAVLHTVNPRLFPDQLVYIINHAEDAVIFCDGATLPVVEAIAPRLEGVRHYVVMTEEARMPATRLPAALCEETLLAAEDGDYEWPALDERDASTICYTSGTTGNPKGVVYSHRAAVLQTMAAASFDFTPGHRHGALEVIMPMAPMFHGNAWNLPYLSCYAGTKLVLPGRNYEPDKLYELFESEKVTVTAGVPTFWLILVDWMERNGKKFSTLRSTLSSGSAPPRALVAKLERDYGVETMQAWGMTEALMATSCTLRPGYGDLPFEERLDYRMKSGRGIFGVKTRIVDDLGRELPHDGKTFGHLRVKGPWIASGYFKDEGGALDEEGWLKTGDMAVIDAQGHVLLTDRSKDVIKSGGEWISSIQLEDAALSHPDVLQAAVIAVPHPTWQERPLMLILRKEGASLTAAALLDHLRARVASWWLPDAIEFIDKFPMTATGKVHKLTLRQQYRDYALPSVAKRAG